MRTLSAEFTSCKTAGLALALALLASCAPEDAVLGRAYGLQVPKGAAGPLPLVILAHGYGVNGVVQDLVFPFSKQVDAKQFLYALPNGTQDSGGDRFWNATDGCCNFEHLPVDDVAFFRALIDDVKSKHEVQPGHVFIIGHSNGAFMDLRLACEASDVIDGVIAVSGSTWHQPGRCPDGRVIPVLLVHGTADTTVPYEGKPGLYPGAVETFERFGRRNGCGSTWEDLESLDLTGPSSVAETRRQRRAGCPPGGDVELWSIDGVGHLPSFDARWTTTAIDWLQEHAR